MIEEPSRGGVARFLDPVSRPCFRAHCAACDQVKVIVGIMSDEGPSIPLRHAGWSFFIEEPVQGWACPGCSVFLGSLGEEGA